MSEHRQLIDQLAGELTPVRRMPPVALMTFGWLLFLWVTVIVAINLSGPIRPGAYTDAVSNGQYSIELILGLLTIGVAGWAAVESGIPGRPRRHAVPVLALLLLAWFACYLVGFASPALDAGMLGKRDHCFTESLLLGLPSMAAGWWLMRRLYPLRPLYSAAALGIAAGLAPGLYMQLACMYDPSHALLFHYLPGVAAAAVFVGAVALVQARAPHAGKV